MQKSCTIKWNTLSPEEWEALFAQIPRSNLLQSYDYVRALCPLNNQRARWGLIEINGEQAGLCQILEAGILGNLIHAVILDRGPLWLPGFNTPENHAAFLKTYNEEFPARLGRKRRIIPEMPDNQETRTVLNTYGFKNSGAQPYQTIMLDLSQNIETLREQLKKRWRGSLKKAEESNLEIEFDYGGIHFPWLMKLYALDRAEKGYDGPNIKLLHALAKIMNKNRMVLIGLAVLKGKAVAGILIFLHGHGATYQIGVTDVAGRQNNAHHLLLWCAIKELKNMGITHFDLGGINDDTAKGVKTFKEGMGGKLITLPGLYL